MTNEDRPTNWWQRLRELAGPVQQREIAADLGVSEGTVSGWKNGVPPSPESVIAAARRYHVEPTDLLAVAYLGEDVKPPKVRKAPKPRKDVPPI